MKVNDAKNLDVQPNETRHELNACKDGGHIFLSGGTACMCGRMEQKVSYCVTCGVAHKQTVKR